MSCDIAALLGQLCQQEGPSNEAFQIIQGLRKENPNAFIQQTIPIIAGSLPVPIRIMAMIVTWQMFPTLKEVADHPFKDYDQEVLSALINAAFGIFGEENIALRSNASNLFSKIARLDVLTEDKFGIVQTLLGVLSNPASVFQLDAVLIVLGDILEVTQLSEDELAIILKGLFELMGGNFPDEVKNSCLNVLKNIMDNMGSVLESDENVTSLLQCLVALSGNPGTKAKAFETWTQFTIQYYPMLQVILEEIVKATFVELANEMNDRDVLIQVCMFWEAVAECEKSKSAQLGIIRTVADKLIPVLFRIAASVPSEECDMEEEFEPHIAAATALQGVVACAKDAVLPVLGSLIQEFGCSSECGLREASLHCINFIIQFCDSSPVLVDSLNMVAERLTDPVPRVRDTAIYCVHALLQSILTKGNDCPFAALIPQIKQHIMNLAAVVLRLLKDDSPEVAATACSCMADFLQFPGFPYVGVTMSNLLSNALQGNLRQSECAFSALQSVVDSLPVSVTFGLCAVVTDILKQLLERENCDFRVINEFFCLLQNVLIRLPDRINDRIAQIWELLSRAFELFSDEAPCFLPVIAALARAGSQVFGPFLQKAAELLLAGLQTTDRDDAIPRAAVGVSLLSDRFDMTPFAAHFFEALTAAMASDGVTLQTKRFVADAIGDLATSAPSVFCPVAGDVLTPVTAITSSFGEIMDSVEDLQEDDEIDFDKIVLSFANCLKKCLDVLMAANSPLQGSLAESVIEVLEFVGGMKEHSDVLLSGCVDIMAYLSQAAPAVMKEYFENEPGFEVILREASEAGVNGEALQVIQQFLA